MARKILANTDYTFDASERTITVPVYIGRERLILITNVSANRVIYNFSDPSLRATSYTETVAADGTESTVIVLNYDTSTLSDSDELQIVIDEYNEKFEPSETILDPVNKMRVSQPEALIDTDFEFGTQITKWENLALVNNRGSSYPRVTQIPNITSVAMPTGSTEVTVTTGAAHGLTVGTPITVTDTNLVVANGNFIIESVTTSAPHTFTYTSFAENTTATTSIFDQYRTSISKNEYFTGASIGGAPSAMTYDGITGAVTVTTSQLHCLALGNEISVVGTTADTNPPNGNFYVARIISPTQFVYYVTDIPTGTVGFASASIYNRPQSLFMHRPFDGGVFFSCNGSSSNQQAIRQTRRYFRYQSGKGIQISSGTVLKPTFQLDSLTAVGTEVTVVTKERHNLEPGASIAVSGTNESEYNGDYVVSEVINPITFRYIASEAPAESTASGDYAISVSSWYGGVNRIGMFDQQNGVFWEYDGQELKVGKRSSTYQLSGKVSVTQDSNTVLQTDGIYPTGFAKQLEVGDYVVVRGQSYRIQDIASDTSMTISPAYRGATADFVNISKTIDTTVSQSGFNLDKIDGTGPSGYNIDLTKMQMFYIDYTWYGAGFIRYGVRGPRGDIIYVHKTPNNNINSEAYMRSGNLPARYESSTLAVTTKMMATFADDADVLTVASTAGFPPAGTLCVRNGLVYEFINYTGKTDTTFTGITRAKAGANSQTVTMSIGDTQGVVSANAGIQIGQRIVSQGFPDTAYVTSIDGTTIGFSQASTATNPTVLFSAMGATAAQTFTYSTVDPTIVELAYPSFGPSINHWGTSVIMDGRFDPDKSLVFTYGQTDYTNIASEATKALLSIRVAPSVDNGQIAPFGGRELINRLQLTLDEVGVSTKTENANMLVRLFLNGVPSSATPWTNAVGGDTTLVNSSLAQIADYAGGTTAVSGGEITGGFFMSGTASLSLDNVRDLGNAIMGGGGTNSNTQIYPDGPDVLTIAVTNLSDSAIDVLGRVSWTEAQA